MVSVCGKLYLASEVSLLLWLLTLSRLTVSCLEGAGVGESTWPQCPLPRLKFCNQGIVWGDRDTLSHCPGELRQADTSSLEKWRGVNCPASRRHLAQVWALETSGLCHLLHGLGTLLYLSLGLNFLICKIGEVTPTLQGCGEAEMRSFWM